MFYGGVNLNYPELATFDGLVEFAANSRELSTQSRNFLLPAK